MRIDDCKKVSVKEVKGAICETMDEAKVRLEDYSGEKMNEVKARLEDAAVELVETQVQDVIDHVA